jgi:hypothetical protein
LSFGQTISHTSINNEPNQELAPFISTSPIVSSVLSLLDNVQSQDLLDKPSPETSRSSILIFESTKTKRKHKLKKFILDEDLFIGPKIKEQE